MISFLAASEEDAARVHLAFPSICELPGWYFKIYCMLIVEVKSGESIDSALRRYKRKFQTTGMIKELRRRKQFEKPSVVRRNEILKAVYKENKQRMEEG